MSQALPHCGKGPLRLLLLVLFGVVMASGGLVGCADEPATKEPIRVIMTPFNYTGFGSSTDSVLVVIEVVGTFTGQRCLFFQMLNAPVQAVEISRFKGEEISVNESIFIIEQMDQCQQSGISCLPGLVTKTKREFVVQVDRYGSQGGLLAASVYSQNCERESSRVARNTLPIGDVTPFTPEVTTEPVVDGGG